MNDYDAYQLIVNGLQPIDNSDEKLNKKKNLLISKEQQIDSLRVKHKIKCSSKTKICPEPIEHFTDLITKYNLVPEFLKSFESLKYVSPTPVQMQSIPIMLERHNVLTLAPTGSGKTAAFLIPILNEIIRNKVINMTECSPQAVVLSPTIELAKQIYQECICLIKELNKQDEPTVAFCCKEKKKSTHWKNMMNSADIIICTPYILKKLIRKKDSVISVSMKNMRWLAIDESDKMLEDTVDSFKENLICILKECLGNKDFRVAMFSATQNSTVWDWARQNLSKDLIYVTIGVNGAAVETIKQELRYCQNEKGKLMEIKMLLTAGKLKCPCLIFLDKSDSAFHLNKLLEEHGKSFNIKISAICGSLSDGQRRNIIADFREGKIHFLICTNLLSRGLDFKGVETVINYDLPKQKEEYIHRIGRTGRAGNIGHAISLWTDEDVSNGLVDIMQIMKASEQPVNEELFELAKKRMSKRHDKSSKLLSKLKVKYRKKEQSGHGKFMRTTDKRRKLYLEKCVPRQRYLEACSKNLE